MIETHKTMLSLEPYLPMINQDLEECVHEKNAICKNAAAIKQNRLVEKQSEQKKEKRNFLFKDT